MDGEILNEFVAVGVFEPIWMICIVFIVVVSMDVRYINSSLSTLRMSE